MLVAMPAAWCPTLLCMGAARITSGMNKQETAQEVGVTEKGAMKFITSSFSALFYKPAESWGSSLVLGGKQQG